MNNSTTKLHKKRLREASNALRTVMPKNSEVDDLEIDEYIIDLLVNIACFCKHLENSNVGTDFITCILSAIKQFNTEQKELK